MSSSFKAQLCAASALAMVVAAPAWAQTGVASDTGNDIIVTAQRIEQRLQDVPISVSVLEQKALQNNNITNIKDIAAFTPSLTVNSRYGSDSTTFAIRGFTQDQRTFSTVGVFFADVVSLRGSGASLGGDGAGPGAMFDLQNVQVLKGPQGTLFGRNVTGGAVLLVPNRPTDRLEGYVEGSVGNYDMWRGQGVLNLPLSETFRVRLGVDHMQRDGYLKNIGNLGDGAHGKRGLGDVDYTSLRLSLLGDLTPDLENYTVFSYSNSQSNGTLPSVKGCRAGVSARITRSAADNIPMGDMACAQIARQNATGNFWTVSNRLPDHRSDSEQWQAINTLTWRASDSLTVKYIASYGELKTKMNTALYGDYFLPSTVTPGTETSGAQVTGFAFTHVEPTTGNTQAQSSYVQELQLQGTPGDGRLTWQAGAYFEGNDPLGPTSSQTALLTPCADINTFNCLGTTAGLSAGSGTFQLAESRFRDYAVYGQASYRLTDKLTLTAGARYTWDSMKSQISIQSINFTDKTMTCTNAAPAATTGVRPIADRFNICGQNMTQKTDAPTWTVNLDYKPIDELMVYAKYSRGYRQGGIAVFGPDEVQKYDAEQVDTYEIGAKASWRGALPGFFNVAAFYNDFRNQQLLLGVSCDSNQPNYKGACNPNATVVNAGKSRLQGFEIETGVTAFDMLRLGAAYSYLNTKIVKFNAPTLPSTALYNTVSSPLPVLTQTQRDAVQFYDSVPGTVPHKLTLSASLMLPVPESVGKISIGGTFIYSSKYRVQADAVPSAAPNVGVLPGSKVVNMNVNWEQVGGMPIDASFFVTNLNNEKYYTQSVDSLASRGFVGYFLGEPRMYGFRLKYSFGQ